MKKIYYFLIFFIIFVFAFLFFMFASFYDLQISFYLADLSAGQYLTNNFLAIFFEVFGEFALFGLSALALGIIFWALQYKLKTVLKYLLEIIIFSGVIAVNFFGIYRIFEYIEKYTNLNLNYNILLILIIFSIIFAFFIIFLLKKIKKNIIYKLFWFSSLIILVAVFSNITIQILKGDVFGRLRFCAMNYINDFSNYTPWWQINGDSLVKKLSNFSLPIDAFRSFPSGHVSAISILFCFWFLPLFLKNKISFSAKIWCYSLPVFFVVLVGLSRIVAGAHFLSDVLFAILINLIFIAIFVPYLVFAKSNFRKKKNKKV